MDISEREHSIAPIGQAVSGSIPAHTAVHLPWTTRRSCSRKPSLLRPRHRRRTRCSSPRRSVANHLRWRILRRTRCSSPRRSVARTRLHCWSEGSRRVTTFVRETSASAVKSSISTPLSVVKSSIFTPRAGWGRIGQGMYVLAAGDRDKKGVVERDHGTGSRTPYRVRWSDGDSDWLRPEDIVLDEAAAEENRAAAEALAAEERARSDASCDGHRVRMRCTVLRCALLPCGCSASGARHGFQYYC